MTGTSTNISSIMGMSTLAVHGALVDGVIPEFQALTGATIKMVFDPTKVLLQRIDKGEQADFIVAISSDLHALVERGVLSEKNTRALVRTGVGVAVSPEAPTVRLDTVEQLTAALLGARSVAYSRTGASGIYFLTLLQRLGIDEEVNRKATVIENTLFPQTESV